MNIHWIFSFLQWFLHLRRLPFLFFSPPFTWGNFASLNLIFRAGNLLNLRLLYLYYTKKPTMLNSFHLVPFLPINNFTFSVFHPLRTLLSFPCFSKRLPLHLPSNLFLPNYMQFGIFRHTLLLMYHSSVHFVHSHYLTISPAHFPPLQFTLLLVILSFPHPYSRIPCWNGWPPFSKAPRIHLCGVLLEFLTSQVIFPFYVMSNFGYTSITNTKKLMNFHPSPLFCFLGTRLVPYPLHLISYFVHSTTFPPRRSFVLPNAHSSSLLTHLGISKSNTTGLS